jgi:carboxylate-amine ligase
VTSVPVLGDQIKRELQSIVEVGTRICADVSVLRDEIFRIRQLVQALSAGLAVAAAGTYPPHWKDQVLSPGVRYDSIEERSSCARS